MTASTTTPMLTPAAVAARFGVSTSTVRRWESAGVLEAATRTVGGHRRFDPDDVDDLADELADTADRIAAMTRRTP